MKFFLKIINYSLRDFVESWYSTLTNDLDFTKSLQLTAYKTLAKLGTK